MKNLIQYSFGFLLCLAISTTTFAQSGSDIGYKKGDVEISAGVGLMNTFVDKNTTAPIPPLSLNVSYRLKETLSIGTYMGYSRPVYNGGAINDNDDPFVPELTNNYFQLGLRFGGHFTQGRVDFYGGAMVGYNFSINESDNLDAGGRLEGIVVDDYADIVIFSGHIGAKYLMTEHFGIFGEVGYGVSLVNFGVTTRF